MLSYLHQDYLHSTVSASNGASVEYTPYGLYRTSTGTLPTDRQFQGQQTQSSVGLVHMGARWYDPTIGMWTQPDSIVPNPMDPLALNRYAFVEGNPLRYTDPSGHYSNPGNEGLGGYAPDLSPGGAIGWGVAAYAAASALVVAAQQERQITDLIWSASNYDLYSPRLIRLLDDFGTQYESVPARVRTKRDKEFLADYRYAHFLRCERGLDWERSEVEAGLDRHGERYAKRSRRIVLTDEIEAKDIPVFRLHESIDLLLVSDTFRNEWENRRLTGASFHTIDEYVPL